MSDSEVENLCLNEEEIKEILLQNKSKVPPNETTKAWMIYCKRRGKMSAKQEYTKNIEEVGTFNTLSDFFKFHTAIKEPAELDIDIKLMYFLEGCEPVWEKWLHSGCLLFNIKFKDQKKDKVGARILNTTWEYLLLSLIGNTLPSIKATGSGTIKQIPGTQEIIGLVLNRRDKISLIEVWFRSDKTAVHMSRIIQADVMKQLSFLDQKQKGLIQIRYKQHKDSYSSNSTMKGAYILKSTLNQSF